MSKLRYSKSNTSQACCMTFTRWSVNSSLARRRLLNVIQHVKGVMDSISSTHKTCICNCYETQFLMDVIHRENRGKNSELNTLQACSMTFTRWSVNSSMARRRLLTQHQVNVIQPVKGMMDSISSTHKTCTCIFYETQYLMDVIHCENRGRNSESITLLA